MSKKVSKRKAEGSLEEWVGRELQSLIQSEAMDEQADYLGRGRHFQQLDEAELSKKWVAAFDAAFVKQLKSELRKFDDLTAEYALRGLGPPHQLVGSQLGRLMAGLTQNDVEQTNEEVVRKLAAHIAIKLRSS